MKLDKLKISILVAATVMATGLWVLNSTPLKTKNLITLILLTHVASFDRTWYDYSHKNPVMVGKSYWAFIDADAPLNGRFHLDDAVVLSGLSFEELTHIVANLWKEKKL